MNNATKVRVQMTSDALRPLSDLHLSRELERRRDRDGMLLIRAATFLRVFAEQGDAADKADPARLRAVAAEIARDIDARENA